MGYIKPSLRLMGNMNATITEDFSGTMQERGRGFASDREAWAEVKVCIDDAKKQTTAVEKLHKEMWEAVSEGNGDAFSALCQELERSAARLAEVWAHTSTFAKIAVLGDEAVAVLDEEESQE